MLVLMRKYLCNQRGQALVLFALSLTCLMGFSAIVVDVGSLYLTRTQLANMADAAALAGVKELPGSSSRAVSVAQQYATINGKAGDTVAASVGSGAASLTVTVSRNVNFMVAPILGFANQTVQATATAAVSSAGSATGVVPFGVEKQTFVYGQTYTLKQGGGGGYCGNYGGLALGGNGASVYKSNIENGYSGTLSVGDWVYTETGNIVGPTDQGVATRVSQDPNSTYDTVQVGSPRLIIVPVIDSLAVNGKKPVLIDGFASFFLNGSSSGVVTGVFMETYSNNVAAGSGANYGLYNVKLTQ